MPCYASLTHIVAAVVFVNVVFGRYAWVGSTFMLR